MSAIAAPMCPVCLSAHWLGREPHVFQRGSSPHAPKATARTHAKADKAAVTSAKPSRKKAKKKHG